MRKDFLASALDLPVRQWQMLTQTGDLMSHVDPFCSRAFLGTAEKVGAGGTTLGWQAQHLCLSDDSGEPAALLPLYRRAHSFGDFSRDWGWPPAWERAGLPYYPKLVSGIPYTPSPGPRLLVRHDLPRRPWVDALIGAAKEETARSGASSWQCLFVEDDDVAALIDAGLLMRRGVQFHWRNSGYADFDDFLASFTAEKRKKLKRERRAVQESGLQLETLHGDEISTELWVDIHRHYRDTFERYGNHPAFPLEFFIEVGAQLGRQLVIFLARDQGKLIASSICYRDDRALYGRHWGADRPVPGLHFELCYYQGIAYCIEAGLQRFEPGAQGEHKLARGFEPVTIWSGFWIADPRMRRAVADFVIREDESMQEYAAATAEHLPFKQVTVNSSGDEPTLQI